MMKRMSRWMKLGALMAACLGVLGAQARAEDPEARNLEGSAQKVLEEAASRDGAFAPEDQGFVESLDEFTATARDFASSSRGDRRDAAMVHKLNQLAERVSRALLLANVPPNISTAWSETRRLLENLRARHGVESAPGQAASSDSLRKAARDLHTAADELLSALDRESAAPQVQREALRYKLRYLAEHARSVDEAAASGSAVDGPLARVHFYSERVEQAIGQLGPSASLREAHETFLDCLERVEDALKAAAAKPAAKAAKSRKGKKKAKGK